MAEKTFNTRIKHKRDTHANWTTNNPVLLDGEIAVVVMENGEIRQKVGNGTSSYTALDFLYNDMIIATDDVVETDIIPSDAIKYSSQSLTDAQKAQARANIGAASASEVISNVQEQLDSKVPNTRTVNGKALSANISLSATDIGAAAIETTTATIAASGWSSNSATISNNLITASNTIIIAPAPTSYVTWGECKIRAVTQTAGKITFQCDSAPTTSVTVNLVILG